MRTFLESRSPKRSIGKPFWIGWLVSSVVSLPWVASGYNASLWFSVCVAFIVLGPIGGTVCQVAHDLIAARRLRLLGFWDYAILLSIGVAQVVAGFALFHSPDGESPIDSLKNKTFVRATWAIVLLIAVYAARRKILHYLSQQTFRVTALDNELRGRIRIFAAGAFTLMFFQELLIGSCQFGEGIIRGRFMWVAFICNLIVSGTGITLGLALLRGSRRAMGGARFLLALIAAGGAIAILMSILGTWPHPGRQDIIDVIASVAILILFTSRKFGATSGDNP